MNKYLIIIFISCFILSCKQENINLTGVEKIAPSKFRNSFNEIKLPIEIDENNLNVISLKKNMPITVLKQFIPDSVLNLLNNKINKSMYILPIGKIEKESEWYLILNFVYYGFKNVYVFAFDKKNKFVTYLLLNQFHNKKQRAKYAVQINKEPTFNIKEKNKIKSDQNDLMGQSIALIDKKFIIILKEFENPIISKNKLENPIDTFLDLNLFSADYFSDNQFLSLRDGNDKNSYTFYLKLNNENKNCTGEITGDIKIVNNTGQFKAKADPCGLSFKVNNGFIKIQEVGQCGSKRNFVCNFNGIYHKKYIKKRLHFNNKLKINNKSVK